MGLLSSARRLLLESSKVATTASNPAVAGEIAAACRVR
jgi:hypothetical protein